MAADFDRYIERRGTNCLKYDFAVERGKPADALPLWIADMDFSGPDCIREELAKAISTGIFSYSDTKEDYFEAVSGWFQKNFGWKTESSWLVKTPGVVFALAMAIRALTGENDGVLIQTPVYYPFYEVIRDNNRKIVENPLKLHMGSYHVDFDDFERKIIDNQVKLFILCSPHNPVGRVWTETELKKVGEICRKHNVYVVSDEIHCDLVREGYTHLSYLVANPQDSNRTIVCTAPSKTFNVAGLQVSNIFIPNPAIRSRFQHEIAGAGYSQLNMLGLVACKAAYTGGEEWLAECRNYLEENLRLIKTFLAEKLPEVKLIEPEGTYFAWMDFSALGLSDRELDELILSKAGLWLDAGHIFGKGGSGFQRLAYSCTRATLTEALNRLFYAIHGEPSQME